MSKESNLSKLLERVRYWNSAWFNFEHGDLDEQPITCSEFEIELSETFVVSRCDGSMTFGLAIEALKLGKKVARAGWNGKGMYVVLQEGSLIDPALVRGGAAKCVADAMDDRDLAVLRIKINPHMSIKNVDDSISTWVPSVNDCLAEDWIIL